MQKRALFIIIWITIILGLSNCRFGLCKDDNLRLPQENYTGDQLKIQGYFFGDSTSNIAPIFVDVIVLYNNGVVLQTQLPTSEIEPNVSPFSSFTTPATDIREDWGLFRINGSYIEIERWRESGCGAKTKYEVGTILNDTTFVMIAREYRQNGQAGKLERPNSIYRYRSLTQKPDSTNNFLR